MGLNSLIAIAGCMCRLCRPSRQLHHSDPGRMSREVYQPYFNMDHSPGKTAIKVNKHKYKLCPASLTDSTVREAAKKKRFFLGNLSQICLPTHPPQGFCEIWENER